ncbi:MAG TPA: ATP-binding protein [Syntrophales bacterium]|nr:ATP-binding protein [Syntrophales bacterium]HPN08735.1 ATP-binding protein [Syntrophales bacterium]HQK79914.1 ATP-binding protein [Syntrophales bacterium]
MDTSTGIVVPAQLVYLQKMLDFVTSFTKKAGFDLKRIHEIELCVEEVLVNIFNYAYPATTGDVALVFQPGPEDTLEIRIQDTGIPFNILSVNDPDINAGIDERQIGGLGIFFVRQLMDRVEYRRDHDRNILSLFVKMPPQRELSGG